MSNVGNPDPRTPINCDREIAFDNLRVPRIPEQGFRDNRFRASDWRRGAPGGSTPGCCQSRPELLPSSVTVTMPVTAYRSCSPFSAASSARPSSTADSPARCRAPRFDAASNVALFNLAPHASLRRTLGFRQVRAFGERTCHRRSQMATHVPGKRCPTRDLEANRQVADELKSATSGISDVCQDMQ